MTVYVENKRIDLSDLIDDMGRYRNMDCNVEGCLTGKEWYEILSSIEEIADDAFLKPVYGVPRERIEEIAREVGYNYKDNRTDWQPLWLDYCDSVEKDPTFTEDMIKAELVSFRESDEMERD